MKEYKDLTEKEKEIYDAACGAANAAANAADTANNAADEIKDLLLEIS